jgi:signal transduction histidine kinase
MQNRQMPFNVDHHFLEDVLGDQLARSEELLNAKGIEVAMDCAPELDGYFDADLLGSVINDAIINASRYTQSKIQLSAEPSNDGLLILVSDDGRGFPAGMLGFQSPDSRPSVYDHGQTNLGLYLAARVAAMHERQGVQGTLELANKGRLGGAEYRLWLP